MGKDSAFSSNLTRRSFAKGAAALAAGAGMLGCGRWLSTDEAQAEEADDEIVRYCWHKGHCAGYCSLKCTVRDGRLAVLEPNDIFEDPRYSTCCVKGLSEIQHVYSPERVQMPLKRVGERGEGKFEAISWDQAFDEIYENLSAIQEKYGKGSIWACNSVEASDMDWLGNILGCVCAKEDGIDLSYGSGLDPATGYGGGYAWATNGSRDWVNSKVVLSVSCNYLESSLVQGLPFFEAKEAGTKFITVDPHFSTTAGKSDQWVPINPGTDNAFFLGLVTAVLDEGLYDEAFMKAHTGFTFLVDTDTGRLLGNATGELTEGGAPIIDYQVWSEGGQTATSHQDCADPALEGVFAINGKTYRTVFDALVENQKQYTLEWAESVTGVPAETYRQIAREYAPGPSAISIGHGGNDKVAGCDIAGHGMALLVSLTGNMGKPGAAFGYYNGGREYSNFFTGGKVMLGSWEFPEDMQPAEKKYMMYDLPKGVENDIHAFIVGGNTLVQYLPNMNKVDQWVKTLDYLVVCDIYFTDCSNWADIILPTCSPFESNEEISSIIAGYNTVQLRQKVIDPLFDSRTNFEILRGFAEKWGVEDALPASAEELVRYRLRTSPNPEIAKWTVEDMLDHQCAFQGPDVDEPRVIGLDEIILTPSGKLEVYYQDQLSVNQALPNYEEPAEIGASNPLREQYPLQFYQRRSRFNIHNQFFDATWIKQFSETFAEMNPKEMASRGLENGDMVEVFNDRGHFVCPAMANNTVRPGVVRCIEGQRSKYVESGNLNAVTNDDLLERGKLLIHGPVITQSDTLVEVRKA
ncbi:molybdopterin-dependent oxidoreductase [Adlercreutzia equolifaciens]|uniref:molybdopterin-dependent oxidoreductase n=1 Tax=Adlercreutzia equolifaciens TaxID=446660 RepID=UPI002671AFA7|nr:molybdopterin-dependent oxidoreductase [Adlercreutzia equolifaciens]